MTELNQLDLISSRIEEALQAAEGQRGSLLHHLLEMATQEVCQQLRAAEILERAA
jgi:hypothetical protein